MAAKTKIEWADATVNFWIGCTEVDTACDGCYAREMAKRLWPGSWGPGVPRFRVAGAVASAIALDRQAKRRGIVIKVFGNSMSDMFDNEVDRDWRSIAFQTMEATPNLLWIISTKRGPNVAKMVSKWPRNAWLQVSCGTQECYDREAPRLKELQTRLDIPRVGFSFEPLLEPIRGKWFGDYAISGDESGDTARPIPEEYHRLIKDQCVATGTSYFLKQFFRNGKKVSLPELDGQTWQQMPEVV
jgi:protein gp37